MHLPMRLQFKFAKRGCSQLLFVSLQLLETGLLHADPHPGTEFTIICPNTFLPRRNAENALKREPVNRGQISSTLLRGVDPRNSARAQKSFLSIECRFNLKLM